MSLVTNSLLRIVQKMIGGSGSTGPTVLDDGHITQVMNVVPEIARRGLSVGNIGGWFVGVLRNIHSGADAEQSSILPYAPGAFNTGAYPSPVPAGFDIWLLGVCGIRSTGVGDLTGAHMGINPPTSSQGFGVNDLGVAVVTTPIMTVARFDVLDEAVTISGGVMITEQGLTYQPVNIRLARGNTLVFNSESAGAAEFDALFLMGLFPEGLGQDVAS